MAFFLPDRKDGGTTVFTVGTVLPPAAHGVVVMLNSLRPHVGLSRQPPRYQRLLWRHRE